MLEYSSSHWFTRLSTSPDRFTGSFEKFMASSLPALADLSSHPPPRLLVALPTRALPSEVHRLWFHHLLRALQRAISIVMIAVRLLQVEWMLVRELRPLLVLVALESSRLMEMFVEAVVWILELVVVSVAAGVGGTSGGCGHGAAQASGSAPSRYRDRSLSAELGSRLSRFNGSARISFSSKPSPVREVNPSFSLRSERTVEENMQADSRNISASSDSEEDVIHSGEPVDGGEKVPKVVPSRAWVDEVKVLKKGDIYVGRGSKQRGLLPSFWANRYTLSEFGRDRAVELHTTGVREDLQYGRRVHELSSKRLLCHCRTTEKCHAENLQDLFRSLHPHAFDP